MANGFNTAGIPAVALHSDTSQEERNLAKSKLQQGIINCIFTVDLFNEGEEALTGKTRRSIKDEINDDFPNMPAGCLIKLEKIAKDYILNNIQSSIFNVADLRKMMGNFTHNFTGELKEVFLK